MGGEVCRAVRISLEPELTQFGSGTEATHTWESSGMAGHDFIPFNDTLWGTDRIITARA